LYYVERAPVTLADPRPLPTAADYGLPPLEGLLMGARCRVLSAGWFPRQEGWYLTRRVMPHYIAFVSAGGVADFVIGGTAHRLTPGSVLLMPPGVPQEGRHVAGEPPMAVYSVHFSAHVYGVLDLPALLGLPVLTCFPDGPAPRMIDVARRIVDELAGREPGYVLASSGECMRLLTLLWRARAHPQRAADGPLPSAARAGQVARLAPVLQLIQARYAEGLSLREMAGVVHLHPAYFSTLFKEITGWSPISFLTRYRLDRARELLATTDLPVQEIASSTGFADPSHLRRELRRREGLSPRAYREAKKNPALP
jgi:AraC-like DNA-binding protein